MTKECWWVSEINGAVTFTPATDVNTVITSQATSTSNPMVNWDSGADVGTIGLYLCAASTLSGGLFRLGVWDSSGDPKSTSAQFTVGDMAVGSGSGDVEEFLKSLTSTTTVDNNDCVGIIMEELPTGTGNVFGGAYSKGSTIAYWQRNIFIEGSAGDTNNTKIVTCCLSTDFTPPSTAAKIFSSPLSKSNVIIIPREIK